MNPHSHRQATSPQARNRRTALRYIFFDILSAMLAWTLLFIFRKVHLRLPLLSFGLLQTKNIWPLFFDHVL